MTSAHGAWKILWMSKQNETVFKEKVAARLKTFKNTWHVKVQQLSVSGTPDFLICLNGVFIALELKTDSGKVSKLQEYNLNKIAKCGGISIVLMPQNYDETMLFLDNISQELVKLFNGESH